MNQITNNKKYGPVPFETGRSPRYRYGGAGLRRARAQMGPVLPSSRGPRLSSAERPQAEGSRAEGFTLIETGMVVLIGTMVALAAILISTTGFKTIKAVKRWERIHANAEFTSNAFTYWIKQGDALVLNSPTELIIVLPDPTAPNKCIAFDATAKAIVLGDNDECELGTAPAVTSGDIEVIALNMTKLARSVQIQYTLKAKNSDQELSIQTAVAQRN